MKWNGMVSQREKITMATRLASEKTTHATSSQANGQRRVGRPGDQRQRRPGGRSGICRLAGRCRRPPDTASGGEPIALTTQRLDQVEAELGAQPTHADVHHVRARVEVVSPD